MSAIAGGVIAGIIGFSIIIWLLCGITTVREREVIIIERFGSFKRILTAGLHFVPPLIESPRYYPVHYSLDNNGRTELIDRNDYRISLQQEVMDFPKQQVLTKDGARLSLDAVLSWSISSAASVRTMVYSVNNLPLVLSRLLQAHIRGVASTLDVDEIIENSAAMNVLTQLLNDTAMAWGIRINFVKIQRVEAHELSADLAKKKNSELTNKNVIITAKSKKSTILLSAEGEKDQIVKRAEGESQKKISIATGIATAIRNNARAEAEALTKVAATLRARGEDPIKYMLSQKYMELLGEGLEGARVTMVPMELENLTTERVLGVQPMDTLHRRTQ